MLLALWADFWPANYGPWPTGTPAPVANPSPTNAGSGQKKEYPQYEAWPDRAGQDYWDAREQFLMRHLPVTPAPYVAEEPKVRKVVEKHNRTLELVARTHLTGARMINIEKMLNDLVQQVEKFEQDAEDDAIAILLLM